MLPEVGLPTGLLLVAVVGFRLWPFMAVEFGRNLKAEGGFRGGGGGGRSV